MYEFREESYVNIKLNCSYIVLQLLAIDPPVDAHTKAICDNIDAWAMWLSPPLFIIFNIAYWFAYQHVDVDPPEPHLFNEAQIH